MGKDAAEQVPVGVGALAGSTIMLLTLPWVLATIAGRVDLPPDVKSTDKEALLGGYSRKAKKRLTPENKWHLSKVGCMPHESVKTGGFIMFATLLP